MRTGVVAIVGAVVGFGLGVVAGRAWRVADRGRLAGFGALGLLAGLAIGLSASPVIGATVTAVIALAGTLVPLYLPARRDADANPGPAIAKPDRAGDWLLPFAASVAAGLLAGVALRANDALDFRDPSLRARYTALGFSPAQVEAIMDRLARDAPPEQLAQKTDRPETVLNAGKGQALDWDEIWKRADFQKDDDSAALDSVRANAPEDIQSEIDRRLSRGEAPAKVLENLRKRFPKGEVSR